MKDNQKNNVVDFRIWRAAMSLLKPYKVKIPQDISKPIIKIFSKADPRARRDYIKVLSLIKSSALLNQYQREMINDETIVATLDDFEAVIPIIGRIIEQGSKKLSPKQILLLNCIKTHEMDDFSVSEAYEKAKVYESDENTKLKPLENVSKKTIQRYLKHFDFEGFVDWNGESGSKSIYTRSPLLDNFDVSLLCERGHGLHFSLRIQATCLFYFLFQLVLNRLYLLRGDFLIEYY